ncbi:hypothetical protein [Dokdonella sp.]|uniref:hypothetical protein n=1 Tax=Dokdonella sp. TaxID=2291710 RepID=UPI0026036033|nr:hypothetical protein [Dokdonella sp.]
MTRNGRARGLVAAAVLVAAAGNAAAAGFHALGLPGAQLAALSADGCLAAGLVSGGQAGFRWRVGTGVETLDGAISVRALSASGRYAAGSSLDAERREVASYWDADGRLHRLGGAAGVDSISVVSQAFGVTDEPRIVGSVGNAAAAFVWTRADGLRLLEGPEGALAARAEGLADDGTTIYGWAEAPGGRRRGVLWSAGAPRFLPDRPDLAVREISAASRSARILLGAAGDASAFRWNVETGAVAVDAAVPAQAVHLLSSSEDGRLAVGSRGQGNERVAVVWSVNGGVQPLDRWIAARDIALPPGWRLGAATAISGDGQRIGGWGQHDGRFDSFVLDLAGEPARPACAPSGQGLSSVPGPAPPQPIQGGTTEP